MRTDLYNYQKKGVRRIEGFDIRALLADEMGLGKTLQFLATLRRNHKRCMPAVVVCPASLKWNWARESLMHIGCRAYIAEGRTPPDHAPIKANIRLVIINYEILPYWMDWLEDLNPQLVGVDECQYIKNRDAQRTKSVKMLCRNRPHIVMMSGTPLTSRPAELWPALNILMPEEFNSFMTYAWDYCKPRRTPWGWEYKGATNLDELHELLTETCMIRRRKTDVLHELPDKTRVVIPFDLPRHARKEYEYAESNFMRWLAKSSGKATAKRARKAEQLVKMGYLKRLAASLKYDSTTEWVDNFFDDTDGKLVLFGVHQKIIKPLVERYKSMAVFVDGSVTGHKRQVAVDQFQTKDKVRLFVGNLQAAGVGLTLTAAHNAAFAELGWTPGEHTQGEDRIHRIGQSNAATCYYLVARNTIEEDLCRILQEKQAVLEATLDGVDSGDDLDIFDQLTQSIEHRRG